MPFPHKKAHRFGGAYFVDTQPLFLNCKIRFDKINFLRKRLVKSDFLYTFADRFENTPYD